ncbi:unnamed protein product [Peniophora sp. CBMAI 1063]|nr:unnamed protein product [Peniophora sp. CBMAI 1063]
MSGKQVSQHTKEWVLGPESEYRFELDPNTSLAIRLLRGRAEIFGAELAEGQPSTEYVSEETPMSAYANVHVALEKMRLRAQCVVNGSPPPPGDDDGSEPEPPRMLILGPENSGKTSVCKILTNYAIRAGQDWEPMYVNVDPGEGGWAVPGAISAASVSAPLPTASPANPLGNTATSSPSTLATNALLPLVYWYGHSDTKRNPLLLERLIRNLGDMVSERNERDPEAQLGGIIVDTPSSFASSSLVTGADHRHMLIRACVDAFKINVILVVGHEKLNVEMQRTFGNRMHVVKIPKSGGVVELDLHYRTRVQRYQMHNYMYGQAFTPPEGLGLMIKGTPGGESALEEHLAPSSVVISTDDIVIYRIGEESMAPSSALPIGATRTVSEMVPVKIDAAVSGARLQNTVIALLAQPSNPEERERYDEEILDMTVAGFLAVTGVDAKNRKLTVLSPNQAISFAGRTAIAGSLEWSEQQ